MKLKKIASLALAGIMAVSMLTACGESNTITDNGNDNTNTTPAATYSSTFAAALKDQAAVNGKITMADNAELTADLNKAIEKLSAATILRYYSDWESGTVDGYDKTVYNFDTKTTYKDLVEIANDMEAVSSTAAFGTNKDMLGSNNDAWKDKTVTMLFAVDSTVSANAAVAEVAADLNAKIADLKINNKGTATTSDDVNELHYSYTGSVSVATKTLTENHGMGMHIVAVQITRTANA